jgi:hypothetical protein
LYARIALRRRDSATARSALAASLEIAVSVNRPSLKLAGVCCFAEILEAQGEAQCARRVLEFAAEHPFATDGLRAEIRARLEALIPRATAKRPRPAIGLDELVQRIVVESNVAYVPLIASLS